MSDLVERLRNREAMRRYLPTESGANMYWKYTREKVEAICDEAADEIERLRAALREITGLPHPNLSAIVIARAALYGEGKK